METDDVFSTPDGGWVEEAETVLREQGMSRLPASLSLRDGDCIRRRRDGFFLFTFTTLVCDHESVGELVELVSSIVVSETYTHTSVDEQGRGLPILFDSLVCPSRTGQRAGEYPVSITFYTPGHWRPCLYRGDGEICYIKLDYRLISSFARCAMASCRSGMRRRMESQRVTLPVSHESCERWLELVRTDVNFSSVLDEMLSRVMSEDWG